MSDSWSTHFEGTVGGRPVKVQTYDDGGDLRVVTNQGQDYDPVVSIDTIMPPISKDDRLEIDAVTLDEVRGELANAGFSNTEAEQIVSHFPTMG